MSQSNDAASGDVLQLLSDVCRQAGFKLTRQQVEALREIADSEGGATADKIHPRLQARSPAVSRETIRRTLGELQRAGIVREVDGPDEIAQSSEKTCGGVAPSERKGARSSGLPAAGDDRNKRVLSPEKAGEYRC